MKTSTCDFLVVGAGVVGLAIARALCRAQPEARVTVLEKEPGPGLHASGRNSGVLHSGVYYPPNSLKARICASGRAEMAAYCRRHELPLLECGKTILPLGPEDDPVLDELVRRGRANGVEVELLNAAQLAEREPAARSATGRALAVPAAAVVDPRTVLERLLADLKERGVTFRFNERLDSIDDDARRAGTGSGWLSFGHLFNASGTSAARLAHLACGLDRYAMLPFRGNYFTLAPPVARRVRGLIYPVPDLRLPFLGVHLSPSVTGEVYVGPTARPVLGPEQYRGLQSVTPGSAWRGLRWLLRLYRTNADGFRRHAHRELMHATATQMARQARQLLPGIRPGDLRRSGKAGIRPQLIDLKAGRLVLDFLIHRERNSTHILNAISPAFTSSFAFAALVLEEAGITDGSSRALQLESD